MTTPYSFHDTLVLRTPRRPVDVTFDEAYLQRLLLDTSFREALYIASPSLHDECVKLLKTGASQREIDKVMRAVGKYYTRMSSRCTPFGLFSGCSTLVWEGEETKVLLNGKIKRHTRFDMDYLSSLTQHLLRSTSLQQVVSYFPNSSIYGVGNEYRFVEIRLQARKSFYQISAVEKTPYVDAVLKKAANGVSADELCQLLLTGETKEQEVCQFVSEILESQLLVSELTPRITGAGYLQQMREVLQKHMDLPDVGSIYRALEEAVALLKALDKEEVNAPERYRAVLNVLDRIGAPYEEGKVFQTDILQECPSSRVRVGLQEKLWEGLSVLNRLTPRKENMNLRDFTRRFQERYGNREIPLLDALDTETGIGYLPTENEALAPLINDITLPLMGAEAEHTINWGKVEQYKYEKLKQANAQQAYTIALEREELASFPVDWSDLAPSMSLLFRMVNHEKEVVFLEGSAGSSGANLLARFAHLDTTIHTLIQEVTEAEAAYNPAVVYAEIVHLPESRVGNILLRPAFRPLEIAYLALPASEQQIAVQDLYLSVVDQKIVLRSKTLNKQVIPRLSAAHNYLHSTLPVYQFLCDLQLQGKRSSLSFTWGALEGQHKFLPRVTYGNVIFSLATWNLTKEDIACLLQCEEEKLEQAVTLFKQDWRLPDRLILADGDNELLIHLGNITMVKNWLDTVKNRKNFKLKEALHTEESRITDLQSAPYQNQFIATLVKHECSYVPLSQARGTSRAGAKVKRNFSVGSEWLYFKLYCGVKSADKVLLEVIKPLGEKLVRDKLIDKWFFIRYNDPGFHIRFRVNLRDVSDIGKVIQQCHLYFRAPEEAGYVWKVQLETYEREVERYGATGIELVEHLFYHDSVAVLDVLSEVPGDMKEEVRWMYALQSINSLLDSFGLPVSGKLELLKPLKEAFAEEFKADASLKQQLSQKFRQHRSKIEVALGELPGDHQQGSVLKQRNAAMKPTITELLRRHTKQQLEVPLQELISSCVHMLINRVSMIQPRLHELLIYDLLFRHYTAEQARERALDSQKENPLRGGSRNNITSYEIPKDRILC